jgi:hypothetical protein
MEIDRFIDTRSNSFASTISPIELSMSVLDAEACESALTMEMPMSLQGTYNGGTLRELDPVAVWIEDHRDPRDCCGWGQTLAAAGRKNSGMDLIDLEDLKGDVAPACSLTTGIERGASVLL